jgi:hypothetical protein
MITAGYGMLSHFHSHPSALDVVLFALGSVIGIALIETVVSRGFRRRPESDPEEVIMLGTAANVISVGGAVGVFYGIGATLPGLVAWPIGPLAASTAYVFLEAAELAVAEGVQGRILHDPAVQRRD